jgi:transcriptional regulator with AAA-type ATPase domain
MSVLNMVRKVAKTDANVLITGENGTGKELVAQEIHRLSDRAEEIMVSVDMRAIAETRFESELFGHVKGAFLVLSDFFQLKFAAKYHKSGLKIIRLHGGTLQVRSVPNKETVFCLEF